MKNHRPRGFTTTVGVFLLAMALSAAANAASLRQGSSEPSAVTGSLPGQVLWTYFAVLNPRLAAAADVQADPALGFAPVSGLGDNILRLINPNGAANGNLAGAQTQTVCAMIYVFDPDEEMGECCGCPLSSSQLATFSVQHNLTSNWGIQVPEVTALPPGSQRTVAGSGAITLNTGSPNGAIAIVAASPNTIACASAGGGTACNGGCDPTNVPGYSVTTTNNLLGSITHLQRDISQIFSDTEAAETFARKGGITEVPLSDDAGGDPTNLIYLQIQCGALVGNGTGGGICNCPIE
jgi:hypothetical protein